ncbi:LacI family DNA-binding transcriptional regulator [Microbispora sp. RL4-1S]|uniref:LacI family DNA-binding transcriptional regulator n=1 Tax=Microbispora oryzae TaxID=2806554 RepID=A0A940WJP2_9ACTN|nr:LacI family DNA-binding transcriptional regulator [Microbispora oryzae]
MAKRAGVSIATASKALNDKAEVAEDTRYRVRVAATELSFRAIRPAGGRTAVRTVGLLTDELGGGLSMALLLGVEKALCERAASVVLCDARGDAVRRRHYIHSLPTQVDGLIVLGDGNAVRPSVTRDVLVPVVYAYGESGDPADLSVLADDAGGARLAAEHLVSLGCRRIGHITGPWAHRAARDRAGALHLALAEAGLRIAGGEPLYGEWSRRWGRHATRTLLADEPDVDAVFCGNDQIADGACEALADLGRDVPGDVAVVGYDNWEALAADCRPPLTTVDLDLESLGAVAVEYLLAALAGQRTSGVVRHPARLVLRESSARAVH